MEREVNKKRYPVKFESNIEDSETLQFNKLLEEIKKTRDELQHFSFKTAINSWELKLPNEDKTASAKKAVNLLELCQELYAKKVLQKSDSVTKNFSLGNFLDVPSKDILQFIDNANNWDTKEKGERAEYYTKFLDHLNEVSFGLFRGFPISKRIEIEDMKASILKIRTTLHAEQNETAYILKELHEALWIFGEMRLLSSKNLKGALSPGELEAFLNSLHAINARDYLVARVVTETMRKIGEILRMTISQINFNSNKIMFENKTKSEPDYIDCKIYFMNELKKYIEGTNELRGLSEYVFISRTGKLLSRHRINFSFCQASNKAGIKKVSPEMLRGSALVSRMQNLFVESSRGKINENIQVAL